MSIEGMGGAGGGDEGLEIERGRGGEKEGERGREGGSEKERKWERQRGV